MTTLKALSAAFAVSGETVVELVRTPGGVAVYIREEDEEVPSADMTGELSVTTAAGATSRVPLIPVGGDRFEIKGPTIPAGSKVGVMLINEASQARAGVSLTVNRAWAGEPISHVPELRRACPPLRTGGQSCLGGRLTD